MPPLGIDMFFAGLWLIAGFCIFLLIAQPLLNMIELLAVGEDQRNFNRFQRDAHARGLDSVEVFAELDCRIELARLRRLASDAVIADPQNWKKHLDDAVAESFKHLAGIKPDLLQMYGSTLRHLPYTDILYPDACARVDRVTGVARSAFPHADFSAALKTLR